ncbi:hypothetical protein PYCCODRAFT_1402525 [Trametes coccinea BRFM310]|uniref:Uncharacterized protein n=1 Tax=Trametes coccinea (strain BRFM310) TaxID=1353009 RepID=A0A1Y2J164_TRAC3|nr:hypothetical protein PYCCODRAFT_1402525 [Trametes coccinea BRFM310]
MPDTDEYDDYYSPIDPEELVDIEVAAIATYTQREATPASEPPPESQSSQQFDIASTPSPDEFDSYDFSEFTAEDFERIDASILRAQSPEDFSMPPFAPSPSGLARGRRASRNSSRRGGLHGGPQLEIALETAANADVHRVLKGSQAHSTPFQQFRRWNNMLSVTDLVGPSWCEVQFDYGLRQKRYKKLEDRPQTFTTAEGKTITVVKDLASKNDRTVSRGKSVHKVLEREVQPEVVPVEITTQEERWGLRLVNMLAALQTLTEVGYCREIPVFGVVHGQVVTGIIDEITRGPVVTKSIRESPLHTPRRSSPNKRSASPSTPATPSQSSSKKSKHDEAPSDQIPITNFFSPSRPATPLEPEPADIPPLSQYTLHISDTKTRIRPTLPPDEDAYSSRLQLMLYHRLLSNLLASADSNIPATSPLNFAALWAQVGVNSARRFSESFLIQAGLTSGAAELSSATSPSNGTEMDCLNDLVAAFKSTAQALCIARVDDTLTLIYRKQPERKRRKGKDRLGTQIDPAVTVPLSPQATQGIVGDFGVGSDSELARAIFESLQDSLRAGSGPTTIRDTSAGGVPSVFAQPFGVSISDAPGSTTLEGEAMVPGQGMQGVWLDDPSSSDPQLAWALQQSQLEALTASRDIAIADEASASRSARLDEGIAKLEEGTEQSSQGPAVVEAETIPEHAEGSEATPQAISSNPIGITNNTSPANDRATVLGELDDPSGGTTTAPASSAGSEDLIEADESMTVAELDVEARIIGTKEFQLDNSTLDSYLTRVLAWWHGERQPEGVSVELTRRCATCEYREGCEWREKKAQEAIEKYREGAQSSGGPAEPWL